jgi:hypothetical protein
MMSNFPCPRPAYRAEQPRCRVIALVTVKGFAATVIFHAETKSDRLFADWFNTPVDFTIRPVAQWIDPASRVGCSLFAATANAIIGREGKDTRISFITPNNQFGTAIITAKATNRRASALL